MNGATRKARACTTHPQSIEVLEAWAARHARAYPHPHPHHAHQPDTLMPRHALSQSNVLIESRRRLAAGETRLNDFQVLLNIRRRGLAAFWTGCSARMLEGALSGAVLLASKESLGTLLRSTRMSDSLAGFLAGAGGGAAQAVVMAPTALLVTTATACDVSE